MALPYGFVKVSLSESHAEHWMYQEAYGPYDAKVAESTCIPYCALKKVIGQFYFLEYNRFVEQQKSIFTQAKEDYYLKEVIDLSLTLLRFTIATGLGEARHYVNSIHSLNSGYYSNRHPGYGRRRADYYKVKGYMKLLMGGVGFTSIPHTRDIVYRTFVPESQWLRYLTALRSVFLDVPWSRGMGGPKWGKGCEQALRLYKALSGGMFKDVAIEFDTLVNHFHNGGLLLNKFYCEQCISIENLLECKQKGLMIPVQKLINTTPCHAWGKSCARGIRVKPISLGGNNGKEEKKETIKGVYQLYYSKGMESSSTSSTGAIGIEGSSSGPS